MKTARKRIDPLLLGILASVVVVALVVCTAVLGFAGTSGNKSTSPPGVPTADEAARQLFLAIERRDTGNLVALTNPDYLSELKKEAPDEYEQRVSDCFFKGLPDDTEFDDLEYKTKVDGDTATVTLTGGKARCADACGKVQTKSADELLPSSYRLVQRSGGWYVDPGSEEQ